MERESGSWEPIGNYDVDNSHIFKGTFQGNNHIINNLYINTTRDCQGLFGYLENATITGVRIGAIKSQDGTTNIISITGNSNVGAIAGEIKSSTIQNCGNNANIKGNSTVGGIIGFSVTSQIIGVYNKGNITTSNNAYAGGIIGNSGDNVTIKYSYNTGDITGKFAIGGITGGIMTNYLKIYNCYNTGVISCTGKNKDSNSFVRRNCRKITYKWIGNI